MPLSVGFRVPAVVVELANRLLPALDVVVPAARSLRRDGTLEILKSDDVAAAARQALTIEGSVGVIAAEERDLHRLYVVLTRAVTGLTVLHTRSLPAPL